MSYSLLQQAAVIVGAVELYEFDFGEGVVEYYTSSRKSIFYDWREGEGKVEYKPLPVSRSPLKASGQTGPDTLSINLPTRPSFMGLLGKGSVSRLQLRIVRGFGPLTAANEINFQRYWFIGDLADMDVTRARTQANLRSQEYIFRETQVPRVIFQGACNHDHYGPGCGLAQSDFSFTFDLRDVSEDGTLLRLNVNPATQDPSGSKSYDPEDHVQLGDGVAGLDSGFDGIGFYTYGRVWRDSLPEAPRHVLAHIYVAGDGANQCRLKVLNPIPTLEEDNNYEGSSNNLLQDSEEPDGPSWTLLDSPLVSLYDAPGPFFATKAAKILATQNLSRTQQVISSAGFTNGATYTYAFWIKRGDNCKETDIIVTNQDGDLFRIKVEWLVSAQPHLKIVGESGDYVGLVPSIIPVGGEGWFLLYLDINWEAADGDVTIQVVPDSDLGGAFDKHIWFYAGMVKQGSGITQYEANQKVWMTASFGCQKTGFACSLAKFSNTDNMVSFFKQPSVHPVLSGFRSL